MGFYHYFAIFFIPIAFHFGEKKIWKEIKVKFLYQLHLPHTTEKNISVSSWIQFFLSQFKILNLLHVMTAQQILL